MFKRQTCKRYPAYLHEAAERGTLTKCEYSEAQKQFNSALNKRDWYMRGRVVMFK